MILVDSDVFLIDLRYQRDRRFGDNRAFLDRLAGYLERPPLSGPYRGRHTGTSRGGLTTKPSARPAIRLERDLTGRRAHARIQRWVVDRSG